MADQKQQPRALTLPEGLSPDQLDVITELSSLLSRLRAPTVLPTSQPGSQQAPRSGTTPLPAAAPTPAAGGPGPSSSASQGGSGGGGEQEIALRDFPAATDHLRHKLAAAKAAVLALPDMHKTTADQEREVAELERRIAAQRAQIASLVATGERFAERMRE
ncbi:hypothetical protein JX265_002083 [Neoarthrinium moseri]|uniref:Mediator of RNA polymerase II transcription subunit 9 n=1 Tax=Neoarthrinium moseri TaxID=1658444 RepID=A0A9P9WWG7_9PEZI|nr:uncharacterized protein JN550_011595 [Neoarthrinium moseri]KAI1840719.1 hypothetical protein JX266_013064 [Neoarthrinium moseri]KAI1860329.1 hypothetical protein JN550_011595 [Neoarthrinium moseri]KAI1880462.1 hypothetical protein JX265_002083 [Neoarthrinium moseri]